MMKNMDYGKDYKYAHQFENNFTLQDHLPEKLNGKTYYSPQRNPREEEIRKFLKERWKEKYGY
jgi:putative ATPase